MRQSANSCCGFPVKQRSLGKKGMLDLQFSWTTLAKRSGCQRAVVLILARTWRTPRDVMSETIGQSAAAESPVGKVFAERFQVARVLKQGNGIETLLGRDL